MKTLLTMVLCSLFFFAGAQTKSTTKKATTTQASTSVASDTLKFVKVGKVFLNRVKLYQDRLKQIQESAKRQAANAEQQFNADIELVVAQDAQKIPVDKIKKAVLKDSTITVILKR